MSDVSGIFLFILGIWVSIPFILSTIRTNRMTRSLNIFERKMKDIKLSPISICSSLTFHKHQKSDKLLYLYNKTIAKNNIIYSNSAVM